MGDTKRSRSGAYARHRVPNGQHRFQECGTAVCRKNSGARRREIGRARRITRFSATPRTDRECFPPASRLIDKDETQRG